MSTSYPHCPSHCRPLVHDDRQGAGGRPPPLRNVTGGGICHAVMWSPAVIVTHHAQACSPPLGPHLGLDHQCCHPPPPPPPACIEGRGHGNGHQHNGRLGRGSHATVTRLSPEAKKMLRMDCPLSDSARSGRSAGRLCQLEGFELTMTLVLEQSNSLRVA